MVHHMSSHTVVILLIIGFVGHLIARRSFNIGQAIRAIICNQRGEGENGDVKFTPEQQKVIDGLIAHKAAEYHNKLTPLQKQLEDLSKFKTEYEKSQEAKTQEDLVKAQKYQEAEGNYKKQIGDFTTKLTEKDGVITDLKISHALSNEISKQNGFIEESLALVKANAVIDANGNVLIKTRDANGVEAQVPVADGIKKFLTERPHLVRAGVKSGAGSGAGQGDGGGGAGGGQGDTLESLNAQLAVAMKGTDLKLRSELRGKIAKLMSSKGIHR